VKDFFNILFVLFIETKKLKAKQKILFGKNCNVELVIYIHVINLKLLLNYYMYVYYKFNNNFRFITCMYITSSTIILDLFTCMYITSSTIILDLFTIHTCK
jgi:hypothetical protein